MLYSLVNPMTAKYTRAEHLLWIVPIIYGFIAHYSAYSEIILVRYKNVFHLFSFFNLIAIFLIIMIIPYLIHSAIRKLDIGNNIIAFAHIALSLSLLIGITFIYSVNLPININWYHNNTGELSLYTKWNYYNEMCISLVKVFIIVQLVFSAYGTRLLVTNHILSRKPALNQHDYENDLAMQMTG